jgi:predicted dithiol-disulfide oxidoreductase (DUF899 family)
MFGPDYTAGCPSCSAIADGFDRSAVHPVNHDVALWAVSRGPLPKLQGYKRRMGWSFPWASSFGTDFNFDFGVAVTEAQRRAGDIEYNYARGLGGLWGMFQWLDRAPLGRNEQGVWWRRHDEYGKR